LLWTRRFEDITVRELVTRSGTSTGSFYARFPTKETLLPALYDRYDAGLHRTAKSRPVPADDDASLEVVVRELFGRVVDRMIRRHWLFANAPHASSFELSRDRLVDEAARALPAYLGVETPDTGTRKAASR